MAEAIVSRYTRLPEDVIDPIPVTPSTHGIKVTLKDPEGKAMVDWPINCKDGSNWYNYKTNEKGQTIFSITSGAANISINNYNGQYQILDMSSKNINVDAPIGMTTRLNVQLDRGPVFHEFTSSKLFELRYERNTNITIVGGGGGGARGESSQDEDHDWSYYYGGGGGAGYMNNYTKNMKGVYNFVVGDGGAGGKRDSGGGLIYGDAGNSGGTSYIVNTDIRANGGGGGVLQGGGRAKGGLGDGGSSDHQSGSNGGNSPVSFAGGGGGSTGYNGGSPYGGNGSKDNGSGSSGSRGSGGGGGGFSWWGVSGGRGGSGLLRINIKY